MLRLITFLGIVLGLTRAAFAADEIVWFDYPEDGVVLGQGYDLLDDRPTYGTCIEFVPVQDPSQIVEYQFEEVNSHTEVQSLTKISASGSLKMAIVKASARLSFLSDENFKRDTTKFWFNAKITNSSLFASPSIPFKKGGLIAGLATSDAIVDEYKKLKAINFSDTSDKHNVSKCGHGYVGIIISGAALDAFLTFSKSDADSLAEIKGGLEADIAGVFTVKGSFEQRQKAVNRQDSMSVRMFRYGGTEGGIAFDIDGLKASIANLATDAATSPKPVKIGIIPYTLLDNSPQPQGFEAAQLARAMAAYFLTLDVYEKTKDQIDYFFNHEPNKSVRDDNGMPIVSGLELNHYVDLNNQSLVLANQLSSALSICRQALLDINKQVSQLKEPDDRKEAFEQLDANTNDTDVLHIQRLFRQNTELFRLTLDESTPNLISDDELNSFGASLTSSNLAQVVTTDNSADTSMVTVTPEVEGAVNACLGQGDSESAKLMSGAPMRAITLAAREVTLRPIYWSELGTRYKTRIKLEMDKLANNSITPDQAKASIVEQSQQFNAIYRAGNLRRGICRSDFSHPICEINSDDFQKMSALVAEELIVDFPQIQHELKTN